MYGHVITKFSGMGRFTKLWGSAHTRAKRVRGAPLLLSSLAKENETEKESVDQDHHHVADNEEGKADKENEEKDGEKQEIPNKDQVTRDTAHWAIKSSTQSLSPLTDITLPSISSVAGSEIVVTKTRNDLQ